MTYAKKHLPIKLTALLALLAAPVFTACDSSDPDAPDDGLRTFRFEATGGTFLARTDDEAVLRMVDSLLALPLEQRTMHINGPIAPGDGDYNEGWSWHFVASEWTLADFSIELCDGSPTYVEEHVTYYVETVGRYCPWGSRLLEEVE